MYGSENVKYSLFVINFDVLALQPLGRPFIMEVFQA